ncbi:MFS transporter [Leucobacter sp. HY1910]
MSAPKSAKRIHYAWWILVAVSIIVGLGKGALNNTSGLFIAPVTKDLGFGVGQFTLYFSVAAIVTMVFLPIGGKLLAKYDVRQVVLGAITLQAGAIMLFGLMSAVWGWYLLAVPLSMGGTIITVIVGPVLINQWFKTRNGLALGVLSAAGGLIGAIAQPVTSFLIGAYGWRIAYMVLGGFSLAIVVAATLLLLRKSPESIGLRPLGAEASPEAEFDASAPVAAKPVSAEGIEIAVARKSVPFLMLALFFFFITSVASFSQHIPNHLEQLGFEQSFSGTVMSIYMLGVLVGSLILGALVDMLSSKFTAVLTMIVGIIAIGLLIVTNNPIVICVAVALFGLISASIGIIAPAMVTSLFGKRDYAQIYATASTGLALASIVALPAYGFVYDATKTYQPVLFAIIVMLAINIVIVLVAFAAQKRMVAKGAWQHAG